MHADPTPATLTSHGGPPAAELLLVFVGPWASVHHIAPPEKVADHVVVTCPTLRQAKRIRNGRSGGRPILLQVAVIDEHDRVDDCVSVLASPRSVASFIADVAALEIADGFVLHCKGAADADYRAEITELLAARHINAQCLDALPDPARSRTWRPTG